MSFKLPEYHHPDFTLLQFANAPDVKWEKAEMDGVAPGILRICPTEILLGSAMPLYSASF